MPPQRTLADERPIQPCFDQVTVEESDVNVIVVQHFKCQAAQIGGTIVSEKSGLVRGKELLAVELSNRFARQENIRIDERTDTW